MTGLEEMPPDPGPEIGPHCLAMFVIAPSGYILVVCADCDHEVVGTACCKEEALTVVAEHAWRMGA